VAAFPPGFRIGHWTDAKRRTGCTAILPPPGTTAAVDVRGGAPGTREAGVFTPGNLVSEIHGLLFTGGSAFGLAAAAGVTTYLKNRGVGYRIGPARVPIVAAAVLFDLAVGDPDAYPGEPEGVAACESAREGEVETGPVGAGTGATVGKLFGVERAARGGIGCAELRLAGGETVAALAAVNAFGDVVDSETGARLAGPSGEPDGFRTARALWQDPPRDRLGSGGHTTLVCVATSVPLDRSALHRVAIEAHDGIARAVRPAHTAVDGDVVFALAPEGSPAALPRRLQIGAAAAEATARAIMDAVRERSAGSGEAPR
jgi:L-aminopeptidase/D-esterase-like protein